MDQDFLKEAMLLKGFFRLHHGELLGDGLGEFDEETWSKDDETGTTVGRTDFSMGEHFREFLPTIFPNDVLVGEEDGSSKEAPTSGLPHSFYDEVDGTSNRKGGTGMFGSLYNRIVDGELESTALYLPYDEHIFGHGFFYAKRGHGVWQSNRKNDFRKLSGKRIQSDRIEILLEGSSRKGFGSERYVSLGKKITARLGFSSCWAAACIARGRYDGVVAINNDLRDNFAAILFGRELGFTATDWDGNPLTLQNHRNIVVAQSAAHPHIIEALKKGVPLG